MTKEFGDTCSTPTDVFEFRDNLNSVILRHCLFKEIGDVGQICLS